MHLLSKYRNFILYGIIGSIATALDLLIFTVLSRYLGLHYLLANCVSVLAGITCSFVLNRSFNFNVKDKVFRRFILFLTIGLCGLLLSDLILIVCIDYFNITKTISKIIAIVLVSLCQFIANKRITFNSTLK